MDEKLLVDINDKYDIIRSIGSGSFGNVYLAYNKILDKQVALKCINALDKDYTEAQIGNFVEHENLVRIFHADYCKEKNMLFLEMEYHPNGSITSKLNNKKFLPLKQCKKYMEEVLRGLEALHCNNIFHNDIKPGNILINQSERAVLGDYGIAKISKNKQPISALSYTYHIAPETIKDSKISVQTDIYQMGLTFFRLINNNDFFSKKYIIETKEDFENYKQKVEQGTIIAKDDFHLFVPPCIKKVINKAIDIDLNKRYKNASEMRYELEKISIKGDWTIGINGEFIGEDNSYDYTFGTNQKKDKSIEFKAYKISKKNKRKTNISKYNNNSNQLGIEKHLSQFMQDVVLGKV